MSTTNKKFTPPVFGKFAKNVKDLFKKKYEYDHQLKVITKAAGGVSLESGAVTSDGSSVKGYVKGKYVQPEYEGELEAWTAESNESKATLKLTKLADGATVTLGGSTKDKDKSYKRPVASVDLEYSQEYFSLQEVLKSDLNTTKLETTFAVGSDGVSAGAQAVVNFTNGADLTDYNFGVEYAQNDLTASVYTENRASLLNAAVYQKPSNGAVVGAIFKYDVNNQNRALTLGFDHKVSADTTVRGKAELPEATFSAVVESRLNNPALLFQVSAQFASKPTLNAQKLGVSATFGDY